MNDSLLGRKWKTLADEDLLLCYYNTAFDWNIVKINDLFKPNVFTFYSRNNAINIITTIVNKILFSKITKEIKLLYPLNDKSFF